MENPIWKAYQKFDDVIMYGANKGVWAWNWTTGKTKADLANSLLTVAPVFEEGGMIMANPIYGTIVAAAALCCSHATQIVNKKQEVLEKDALDKGLMISPENVYEKRNGFCGPMFGVSAGLYSSIGNTEGVALGTGQAMRSSSYYVMRADYLPPGKNVADRSRDFVGMVKDKLADLVDEGGDLAPVFG